MYFCPENWSARQFHCCANCHHILRISKDTPCLGSAEAFPSISQKWGRWPGCHGRAQRDLAWEIAGLNISTLPLPYRDSKSTGSSRQRPAHSDEGEQSAADPVGAVSFDSGEGVAAYLLSLTAVSRINFGVTPCCGMRAALLRDGFPGKICDLILNV